MKNVRCTCGKIICQVEGDKIIIKCRHCKRNIVIRVETIVGIEEGDSKMVAVG